MTDTVKRALFSPAQLGRWHLPHRLFMAPMTRARSQQPGNLAHALNADYYAQRASAGLIISEATQISQQGQGYSFTPGLHNSAQAEGWKLATAAVQAGDAKMLAQLWHVGRMSHPHFQHGDMPVAPSALAAEASVWVWNDDLKKGEMLACPVPRALSLAEIQQVLDDYRRAAAYARQAGFDGIEIHAANGYLIDQFMRSSANHRQDHYGGSQTNRLRFLYEVIEAVSEVFSTDSIGLRISPFTLSRGMNCPEILSTSLLAARQLSQRGLAYLHLAEADWDDAPAIPEHYRQELRQAFAQAILVAGNYNLQKADWMLSKAYADFIGFGRHFIANPDLPRRLKSGLPLANFDATSLFGGAAQGYTDYPALAR